MALSAAPWRLYFYYIYATICFATAAQAAPAPPAVVFRNETLSFNGVVVGEVKDGRSQISLPALVGVLGAPNRVESDNRTRRLTWDSNGIQLEATPRENAPFAILFQYGAPNEDNQGIIPAGRFEGTLECAGIQLGLNQPVADRARVLNEAGFKKEQDDAETWSVRLAHWAVFLRFSSQGSIDSVVVRVLPDIY